MPPARSGPLITGLESRPMELWLRQCLSGEFIQDIIPSPLDFVGYGRVIIVSNSICSTSLNTAVGSGSLVLCLG